MMYDNYSGDYRAGVTPLPISNREVKLRLADGTTTAGLWESRSSPDFILKPVNSNVDRFFYFIQITSPPFRPQDWRRHVGARGGCHPKRCASILRGS